MGSGSRAIKLDDLRTLGTHQEHKLPGGAVGLSSPASSLEGRFCFKTV